MNIQDMPEFFNPLLTVDLEAKRREAAQHTSLSARQEIEYVVRDMVLAPALSILAEEPPVGVEIEIQVLRRVKDYCHGLVCCRNQVGIGMLNPGPR
jgi:hypothetical protein